MCSACRPAIGGVNGLLRTCADIRGQPSESRLDALVRAARVTTRVPTFATKGVGDGSSRRGIGVEGRRDGPRRRVVWSGMAVFQASSGSRPCVAPARVCTTAVVARRSTLPQAPERSCSDMRIPGHEGDRRTAKVLGVANGGRIMLRRTAAPLLPGAMKVSSAGWGVGVRRCAVIGSRGLTERPAA
jgi:hypothetical protein